MKIFIDSIDTEEIKSLNELGIVDGVVTDPSMVANSDKSFFDIIVEICDIIDGPLHAEVVANEAAEMVKEGIRLNHIAVDKIVIKLPLTIEGLKACQILNSEGISTNITLCFTPGQAILAAKAGAKYISPYVGRLEEYGANGLKLLEEITQIYNNYPEVETKIIASAINNADQLVNVCKIGPDIIAVPPHLVWNLVNHELTDRHINKFRQDWYTSGHTI